MIGIVLCVGLFFYLTHLAKRALERARLEQEEREEQQGREGTIALRDTAVGVGGA
jgi:hypothetical protein